MRIDDDPYEGREQTLIKHEAFRQYLEEVAITIGMKYGEFVYVDAFSGPWQTKDGEHNDSSFRIAVETLRRVQNTVRARKWPDFQIKALFIEKDEKAFSILQNAISDQKLIKGECRFGAFEDNIPYVLKFIGDRFSFVFIDPTGWTGFGLAAMEPLLKHYGEVLINFMFDHINRFIEMERDGISEQMDRLMGGDNWRLKFAELLEEGLDREDAILEVYKIRLKKIGEYKYVSSIRILKPHAERTYFHLVYATNHLRGIEKFSRVEQKVAEKQKVVRSKAIDSLSAKKSLQSELFPPGEYVRRQSWYEQDRQIALERARQLFVLLLVTNGQMKFGEILGQLLERPMVWSSDVKRIALEFAAKNQVRISGLRDKERVPKEDSIIIWVAE